MSQLKLQGDSQPLVLGSWDLVLGPRFLSWKNPFGACCPWGFFTEILLGLVFSIKISYQNPSKVCFLWGFLANILPRWISLGIIRQKFSAACLFWGSLFKVISPLALPPKNTYQNPSGRAFREDSTPKFFCGVRPVRSLYQNTFAACVPQGFFTEISRAWFP